MNRRIRQYWPVVVFPAAVIAFSFYGGGRQGGLVGESAPAIERPMICGESAEAGDRFNLADQSGQVVLLEFWASWCGPCRQSVPVLTEIAKTYEGRGVKVVGVNVEPGRPTDWVAGVHHRLGGDFDCVQDTQDFALQRAYDVNSLPAIFIVDGEGVVRYEERGFPGKSVLTGQIDKALTPR